MSHHRAARLVTVATSALLALMLLGPGLVSAAAPGWSLTAVAGKLPTALPPDVSSTGVAAYTFTIKNTGPSNISQLYLTADLPSAFFDSSRACVTQTNSPNLFCSLGALNNGDSIDFTVAFQASGSGTFNPGLQFNTTGATTSDHKKRSHGDNLDVTFNTLCADLTTVNGTCLHSSTDFAGTWSLDGSNLNTTGTLGRNNPQNTTVHPPSAHIPVTVDDSGLITFDCTASPKCSHVYGVWTSLHVNNGATYSGSAFQVTLVLYGKSLPNGVGTADIAVLHVLDGGGVETLTQSGNACPATPSSTTADCIASVTKVGQNYNIVLWLIQNGGLRGTY